MGHYCGASNITKTGTCGRWLVNYDHCRDHRGNTHVSNGVEHDPPTGNPPDGAATLLADILVDGVNSALSGLVVEYLGKTGTRQLQHRRRSRRNCQPLADAAKAILDLGDNTHETIGKAIGDLLPPKTPDFARALASKVAEKIPLPWDDNLKKIARGLQVIGIFHLRDPTASTGAMRLPHHAHHRHVQGRDQREGEQPDRPGTRGLGRRDEEGRLIPNRPGRANHEVRRTSIARGSMLCGARTGNARLANR
jgi:hypothetical protein